jgi:carbon monoxide dehydrogenase subunit G
MNVESKVYCRSTQVALWQALFDPEAWKAAVPAAADYVEVGDNEYEMTAMVDIGPLKGQQVVNLVFSDLEEPHSCTVTIEHQLVKEMVVNYRLEEVTSEDSTNSDSDEVMPVATNTIFNYTLEVTMANAMINAIIDTFKPKVLEGFSEILGRLDVYALGATTEITS